MFEYRDILEEQFKIMLSALSGFTVFRCLGCFSVITLCEVGVYSFCLLFLCLAVVLASTCCFWYK